MTEPGRDVIDWNKQPGQFLWIGMLTEVVVLASAFAVCLLWPLEREQDPLQTVLGWSTWPAVGAGIGMGILLAPLFLVSWHLPWKMFQDIKAFFEASLLPGLKSLKPGEVVLLAMAAGVAEEVFFRGALQPRIGWLWANILFAAMHPVSPTYVAAVFLLGLPLAWLQSVTGNLWSVMIAHGLYDYLGFQYALYMTRDQKPAALPE